MKIWGFMAGDKHYLCQRSGVSLKALFFVVSGLLLLGEALSLVFRISLKRKVCRQPRLTAHFLYVETSQCLELIFL